MDTKKILIVDDDAEVLTMLEKRLSSAGYTVLKANNGNDAIAIAQTQLPNLILCDIMMPGQDGGAVANALKSDHTTRNIPLIFLTGIITKKEEKPTGHVHGKRYIAKPYDPNELLKIIAEELV